MHGGEPLRFADLFADGVAVFDDFLTPSLAGELLASARRRYAGGEFSAARVGADDRIQHRADVRGDSTCWLSTPFVAAEHELLAALEQLRCDLNRECYLGLLDLEAHYSRYAPGTGYARHVDQLLGRNQRQLSLVIYLNPAWHDIDGGHLRLFAADGSYADIEPIGGRLVCFLTAGREHEVLPTRAERWSVTAWFSRRR